MKLGRRVAPTAVKPKILFVHPNLYGFGGAEIHCIRAIQHILAMGGDVTLVHAGGAFDRRRIEEWSGVGLDPAAIHFISVPGAGLLRYLLGRRMALLEFALANRWASHLSVKFDLVATVYGECTFDHPRVVQYLAYPVFGSDPLSLQHLGAFQPGWRYYARIAYQEGCRLVAGWRPEVIRSHATFTNSKWTAAQFKRIYGDDAVAEALYPGASVAIETGDVAFLPFDKRENRFVMIGRVVPGKRVEQGVEIVRRLREEKGHDVGLLIVGRAVEPYQKKMRELIEDKSWIVWHENLGRVELEQLVARQKWGLHCFPFEHYGYAPAELQALGCITFVPNNGGQIEIIDDPRLQFANSDEAVSKIHYVLTRPDIHLELVAQGARRSSNHKEDQFAARYRNIIQSMLADCFCRRIQAGNEAKQIDRGHSINGTPSIGT